MDSVQQFIADYGYWAVFIGTFLEGEGILLLAGFAAEQEFFDLRLVMVIATIGATAGDQFYFYLGRYHREWLFKKFPGLQAKAAKLYKWVERYPDLLIMGSRFVYGIRIPTPIVLGTSRVAAWRYSLFNFIGAVIWSVSISSAGYFLGHVAERILGNIHKIQGWFFAGIIAISICVWCWHRMRARRAAKKRLA